jgi:hypothetical protein
MSALGFGNCKFTCCNAQSLIEEGAAIIAFKLVEKGYFQEAGIVELLEAPGRRLSALLRRSI